MLFYFFAVECTKKPIILQSMVRVFDDLTLLLGKGWTGLLNHGLTAK